MRSDRGRLRASSAFISLTIVLIATLTGAAQPRFTAPNDEKELRQRMEELKAEYAPYLRSLPALVDPRLRTDLSGAWRFAYEVMDAPAGAEVPAAPPWFSSSHDDSDWEAAIVPQWRYRRGKNGTVLGGKDRFGWGERLEHSNIVWYRRTFKAERPPAGRRLWLCFDAVDWEAEVYLNGELLGRHRVRYEPFRFDITEKVQATNTLAVRIIDGRVFGEPHAFWTPLPDARAEEQVYVRDESRSLNGVLPIGYHGGNGFGILREVYLEQSGSVLVAGVFVRNDLSGDEATVKVELDANSAGSSQICVELLPENFEGRAYTQTANINLPAGISTHALAAPMPEARTWSPDTPFMYRCRISVRNGRQTVDTRDVLFGCRSLTLHHTGSPHVGTVGTVGPPIVYQFEPVTAKWLRILGRGSDKTEWNAIYEVDCEALIRGPNSATASETYQQDTADKAIDGNPETRWVAQGRGQWIQFKLDEGKAFDQVTITWLEAELRCWDFDLLVSQDGEEWAKIDYREADAETDKDGDNRTALPNGMLLLNGEPCYLRGTNIHGLNAYWYWGQQDKIVDALLLLKAANFNCVRVCQHVQFPEVRELLDRMGMMSQQEQGSGYRHGNPGRKPQIMRQLVHTGTVLTRETYNNPGVVLLAFGNECHFDATDVVRAVVAEDPERIVKPISGRLSHGGKGKSPVSTDLWPHVIDDTHTYAGWYGGRNQPATWRFAVPQKTDRLITIGEYGGEALDAYATMQHHYPTHLQPPPPHTDTLWAASQVNKDDPGQRYGLGRKPTNLGEYIEASQGYQAALVADKTIGFRLSPRVYSGYFHFHFLDVTPSFWPKSIVSYGQQPKAAYYSMAQINQPIVALPQLIGEKPDAMTVWVANDTGETLAGARVLWSVSRSGKVLLEGVEQLDVPAINAMRGSTIDLKPITWKHPDCELRLDLIDASGKTISIYRRHLKCVPSRAPVEDDGKGK